jgi:hypothetical protein
VGGSQQRVNKLVEIFIEVISIESIRDNPLVVCISIVSQIADGLVESEAICVAIEEVFDR